MVINYFSAVILLAGASAMAMPELQGRIVNHTDIKDGALTVRVSWECKSNTDSQTDPICKKTWVDAKLVNGQFRTKAFASLSVPLFHHEEIEIAILAPGLPPVIGMTNQDSRYKARDKQIAFYQMRGDPFVPTQRWKKQFCGSRHLVDTLRFLYLKSVADF